MPSPYTLPDNDLLTLGAQAIENSLNAPAVFEAVEPFGYDEAAFEKARVLLETYDDAVQTQRVEYGEQERATKALNEAWDAFHEKFYVPDVAVAKIVFDDETERQVGIDGRRPRAFNDYVQEAEDFYDIVLNDASLQEPVEARGLTAKELEAGLEEVNGLEVLNRTQEREKTEAQEATRERDDDRRAFANWLAEYQKFARVALRDQPDAAEQLGVHAPS